MFLVFVNERNVKVLKEPLFYDEKLLFKNIIEYTALYNLKLCGQKSVANKATLQKY